MKYTELTVHTTTEASEIVADVMWNYTNFGVSVCDVNDVIALQNAKDGYWDYIDETLRETSRGDVLVKCYLEEDSAEKTAGEIMRDIFLARERAAGTIYFGTLEETKRQVDGDDWIEVWKKHFRPIHLSRIVVVPEWIKYEKAENEETVLLDSNMAFGTGEHETTSMCVEELQNVLRPGDICIDVGCGSGILGISAVKLGAEKAYLTDVDPIAVKSAEHNARLNGVFEKCVVAHADLLENTQVKGDVVLANITGEILVRLAPDIPKNMKRSGALILSGIIESRLAMVKDAFLSQGLQVVKQRQKGDWFALVLRFASSAAETNVSGAGDGEEEK
ncbi:MAG: 50S ribosomal protein L11 methyltransferase [Candidatus Borkfalkiaceae bacterium]|nr:50S ribosomal protein L11 methyltransferase [Clostridia bacterium]MDY6223915.1 50S ribosomal protein L11 methyltransferase [Christensenellaceae bacterium]